MSSKKSTVDLAHVDVSKLTKKQLLAVTNKKQRQDLKLAKKSLQRKTLVTRQREVADIQNRLRELELDEMYAAVRQLFAALDDFVATGENVSGKIPFPECPPYPVGRTIVYNFTNAKDHKGTCDLIINNGQDYLDRERLEQAIASDTLAGAGDECAKVIETLLEQAKERPGIEVLE